MRYTTRIGVLLLIVLALGLGAIPAVQALGTADLELTKTLDTDGEIYAGDQVVWTLTLKNNGPDIATGIVVTEDLSGLGDYTLDNLVASVGETSPGADEAHRLWSIESLASGETATLTLTTTLNGEGDPVNGASVTAVETDPVPDNNQASASTGVGASATAEITVKPETLNLGSRGVITVFIRLGEDYPVGEIELDKDSLVCNGATPKKIHVNQKDGGTIMAKFRRQELEVPEPDTEPVEEASTDGEVADGEESEGDETDGEKVLTITCEGTILSGEETVKVTGSDTIRVVGEKKKGLDALIAGFLDTVLPVDDETGDAAGEDSSPTTPVQEQTRNRNQKENGDENGELKRIRDRTECTGDECPGCTGDCSAAATPGSQGNGKKAGTSDDDAVTGSLDNGNQGNGNDNAADTGDGNGRGNSNKPEKEKGNGNGKK